MKTLYLYNYDENDNRLISDIEHAREWKGNLSLCSTTGVEVSGDVKVALADLLQNMSSATEERLLTAALGGCKFNTNIDQVLRLASERRVLETICLDDARFLPALIAGISSENSKLREISLSIASSTWSHALFTPFCHALKVSSCDLECLRIRNWTYNLPNVQESFYRNDSQRAVNDTTSWQEGLVEVLDAIVGRESILNLQIQVLDNFSDEQKALLNQILSHPNCRIAKLDLRIHMASETSPTSNTLEWILPGIEQNTHLKRLHLCGWTISAQDAKLLVKTIQRCHHLENFKFDRSLMGCDPNDFVIELLRFCFLKSVSSYNKSHQKEKKHLNIEKLIPAIRQNSTVESLKFKDMNESATAVNKLLSLIGSSCPNLRFLKIINLPDQSRSPEECNTGSLGPLDCCHLRQLHLTGTYPCSAKTRKFACYEDRRSWFQNALQKNPQLYRFGPGEDYGLTRFLNVVDFELIHLADLNRFGRIFVGKPEYHVIWPLVFERVNNSLHEDPTRQASVIFGLLSNGYLASC